MLINLTRGCRKEAVNEFSANSLMFIEQKEKK
jgi:hypothetical protein